MLSEERTVSVGGGMLPISTSVIVVSLIGVRIPEEKLIDDCGVKIVVSSESSLS